MLAFGSTVLSLVNILATWAAARRCRWGWLVMLLLQVPWSAYDVVTGQWGFLLLSVGVGASAVQGWTRPK